MNRRPSDRSAHQRRIDAHFDSEARYWKDVYLERSLFGVIHQERVAIALSWIDALGLPPGARALDVGCGAGLLVADLARRGYAVDGIDASTEMVTLARAHVAQSAHAQNVSITQGDAHALSFASDTYRLVVALGVLPFLQSPSTALAEMARVLTPDGHVILSSDNRHRLNHLLDPRFSPLLSPVKRAGKAMLKGLGNRNQTVSNNRFAFTELEQLLATAGLTIVEWRAVGFGPFSWLGWRPLPQPLSIRLHRSLQARADRGAPVLRTTSSQHLVLARRTAETPSGYPTH